MSFPVSRPMGRALVVANPAGRRPLVERLTQLGFDCSECDDPYTAASELSRHRLAYRALILSLASLYREELALVAMVKRRFPHVEIWLTHSDGRHGTLAEALSLGADGLADEEGLHRIGTAATPQGTTFHPLPAAISPAEPPPAPTPAPEEPPAMEIGEPVLTADELRALLQDQAPMPPSNTGEHA